MPEKGSRTSGNPVRHFVAGLGSGVASAVIFQPLDLLKTRVQQSGRHSIRAVFRDLSSTQRSFLRSLWRGTLPSALRTGLGSALYFSTLNTFRQYAARLSQSGVGATVINGAVRNHSSALPKLSNTANLITGAVARTFAGFVLMPLTVIKVRYESSLYSYRSMGHAVADIYRNGGPQGFFSGFGATAIRDAPYAGLYVLLYEQMKRRLSSMAMSRQVRNNDQPLTALADGWSASINFGSGILAGVGCSIISNPFDAVKTRIQLQPDRYRNMVHAVSRMVMEDGFRSLWDGLALRMSRKALSSALAWTVYEELIKRAENRWSS